jgi:hypothetical protein
MANAWLRPRELSMGNKGGSYGNTLAETVNVIYEAELIYRRAP